jgi:hypothetical protein
LRDKEQEVAAANETLEKLKEELSVAVAAQEDAEKVTSHVFITITDP